MKVNASIVVGLSALSLLLPATASAKAPPNPFACQGKDHKYSLAEIRDCVIPRVFYKRGDIHFAQEIAECESSTQPWEITNSGIEGDPAEGLFQFLTSTWRNELPTRINRHSILHPVFSAEGAEYLSRVDKGWREWSCANLV